MEQLLFVLLACVLVSFCSGQSSKMCHQQPCPEYQVTETNKDFEERLYVATDWITTKLDSKETVDVLAANKRLKDYCQRQKEAGHDIPDSWPVLITVTEGKDASDFYLSWFVPPGTEPEIPDALVNVQHKNAATVYVRSFGGSPSLNSGQENAKVLREALIKAGKTFDPHTSIGAAYDSYFSLIHHNEIWIYAAL